jgi:DNA-binding LytR/AlgR family response regulator
LREAAGQIRGLQGGAFRASRKAYLIGAFGWSLGFALFLGFVGAFGTMGLAIGTRLALFVVLGLGCTVLSLACLWSTGRIAWFAGRPLARQAAIALMMTPLTAVWVWAVVGFAFFRRPWLPLLPVYLAYAFGMSVAMAALSWAIFHPRRGRAVPAPAPAPAARFLERLPLRLREADLYAVEADDHYLKVRTSKGAELILMRLSDALVELEGVEGVQTHRSWWVAKAGVADIRRRDGRSVLLLKDGTEAPVSRTYAKAVRDAGWL